MRFHKVSRDSVVAKRSIFRFMPCYRNTMGVCAVPFYEEP